MANRNKMSLSSRLKHAWNAFANKDNEPTDVDNIPVVVGGGYSTRPDRIRYSRGSERSIINAVYNRIALDVASITIEHVRLDDAGRFLDAMDTGLNNCLTVEANIDQTAKAFIIDAVESMFCEGCVGLLPIDTDIDPTTTSSYDILTMRTCKILEWYPQHVKVRAYNDKFGRKEDIMVSKADIAIIENPMYMVMNEPNSTVQRLIRKLNLLDNIDDRSGSDRLDIIIQLPYSLRSEARRKQAQEKIDDIERQLKTSPHGIAYADATDKIIQLNRPLENNLMKQIEYLTSMLYSQLGITDAILNGTASSDEMNNYYSRTIEPILSAICDEMERKFLSKTARTQKQAIRFFRDPLKLVPTTQLAELADKLTRNEIMTSNEIRQVMGLHPSDDPNADQLRNKNLSASNEDALPHEPTEYTDEDNYY